MYPSNHEHYTPREQDLALVRRIADLKAKTSWTRDILDPLVAREGPEVLTLDQLLLITDMLQDLTWNPPDLFTIQASRIHKALMLIIGGATRWPEKIIEKCEAIIKDWEARLGPLKNIGIILYEKEGRLWEVCKPKDLSSNVG
jgi:hypothetical protein